MAKHAKTEVSSELDHVEKLTEILDEDHLEFEELLLDVQQRLITMGDSFRRLSRRIDDIVTELDESRQFQEAVDTKLDQLALSVAELSHHNKLDRSLPE